MACGHLLLSAAAFHGGALLQPLHGRRRRRLGMAGAIRRDPTPSALCSTQKRRSETELRDCAGAADSGPPTCSQRIIFLTHSRRCISSLSHTNTTMQFLGANDAMCALLMPHLGLQVFLPNPRKLAALSVSVSGPQSHSRTRTASVPVLLFSVLIPEIGRAHV